MRTKARRVAVIVFDEVELLDVAAPLEVLSTAGRRWNFRPYKVEVVAPSEGLVTTRNQLRIEATTSLANATPAEIVLIPGGYGARRFADDASSLEALTRLAASAEIVASVGAGVLALVRAGLSGEAKLAVPTELESELAGLVAPHRMDLLSRLTEGERVFTARHSGAALELALALVERTMGPKLVAMVRADLGLDFDLEKAKVEVHY
jgi:transcriptional regulator GlxA family with amidase domain